jgi:hypothetical protein
MFVTRILARLTIFAGLMALPGTILTAAYAQQALAIGDTDIGGTVVGAKHRGVDFDVEENLRHGGTGKSIQGQKAVNP